LTLNGFGVSAGTNTYEIPNNTTLGFEITVTGRNSGGGKWGTFRFSGSITNNGGTLNIVSTAVSSEGNNSGAVPAGWSVALGTTSTRLTITVTGTAENIGWVGRIKAVHNGYN
jgi:hypothetical protein